MESCGIGQQVESTAVVNSFEVVNVVAKDVLPSITADCWLKPFPRTWIVVSGLPALISDGETELISGAGFTRIAEAVALRVESATLTALIATVLGVGGTVGAVYRPDEVTVPTVASPPGPSFTDHVTLASVEPLTAARNCTLSVVTTVIV